MRLFKYIYILGVLSLFSCEEDFLINENQNVVSSTNFFITEEDYQQATVGMFAPLRNLYGIGLADYGAWTMGEMRSDNTIFIYNEANRGFIGLEYIDQFIDDANGGHVNTKWDNDFIIIGRANQILSHIEASEMSDAAKDYYSSQALFMRAFAYFDLVQYFGDVPLKLEAPTAYNNTSSPRVSTEEIYAQITDDLLQVIDRLPSFESPQQGFITVGAARTLLGNIYLVREQWSEAEAMLLNVSGYTLLDNYAAIFDPNNKGNQEIILEVQYWDDQSAGLASNFAYNFLPVLSDVGVIEGFPSGTANNAGGWNTPTPDMLASYQENDMRLEASIGFYTGGTYENIPYVKKYVHSSAIAPNTNNNWPIYRYAEVLLMLAEAKNEQGKADALSYYNMVHAHSRTGLEAVNGADQETLRNLIFEERRVELAFENKRWLDLVRTNQAIEVMNAQGAAIAADPQAYYFPEGISLPAGAYEVTQSDLLFAIPQREIRVNTEIGQEDQNPGY